MTRSKKRYILNVLGIVLLTIGVALTFFLSVMLLCKPLDKYAPNWFTSIWGIFFVLGLTVAWLALMKFMPVMNFRAKLYMTLFVLTVFAGIITCWIGFNAFAGAMH